MAPRYKLIIESEYIGNQNCSDKLYVTHDIEEAFYIIIAICNELIKIDLYQTNLLGENDLIVGIDTGPYNFIMKSGKAYYIDFYPPRHRIEYEKKVDDIKIITDYPKPRSKDHAKHLIYSFYTRNGLWIHALSHLWAALDSNKILKGIWMDRELDILLQVYQLLNKMGLRERVKALQKDLASSQSKFNEFRKRYFNHRVQFYRKNSNKGFYVKEYKVVDNIVKKIYFSDRTKDIKFTYNEGQKMLDRCCRYFNILNDEVKMTVPSTKFKLITDGD
jgi:hypothetical protein